MQSYLDLSMMIVAGAVVLLLLFILSSFIILSKRASSLEVQNQALKKLLEENKNKLMIFEDKCKDNLEAIDRKTKNYDRQLNYVTQTLDELIDKQKSMDSSFDNLNVKVEQTKKEFENNSVENQPIILAKRLLAQGMSIDEVIEKTNLPNYEVSMLAKVHNLQAKNEVSIEEQAHKLTDEFTKNSSDLALSDLNTSNPSVNSAAIAPKKHAAVASLKARDAYGISKSILRRPK